MSNSDSAASVIIQKVNDTIQSCTNEEQLKCAYRMLRRSFNAVSRLDYGMMMKSFHQKRVALEVPFSTFDGWVQDALYSRHIK